MTIHELLLSIPGVSGLYWDTEMGYTAYAYVSGSGFTYLQVPQGKLSEVHPLLPEYVRWQSSLLTARAPHTKHIPWETLVKTVEEWCTPVPPIIDHMGEAYHVQAIYSCERGDHETFNLHCSYYETQEWRPLNYKDPVKVLHSYGTTTITAFAAMLDNHFPGWHERYQNGVALGVDERVLAQYMLGQASPIIEVSMSGVEFTQP